MDLRKDALQIFAETLRAADASNAVRRHLKLSRGRLHTGNASFELAAFRRVRLLAAGKAAPQMARAVREVIGERLQDVLVITKQGHAGSDLKCIEAGHPVPDEAGLEAAHAVREFVSGGGSDDLLIVAISGGASALLPAPIPPITLQDKQQTTSLLLKAGANIEELNAVRKHLSFLKGGRLAALAFPATVLGLALSDVIGDRLDVIGSGLTAPDPTMYADALEVLNRYGIREAVPVTVRTYLERGAAGELAETPKPGEPVFERVYNIVVGSNQIALEAAAKKARELGYRTSILSSELQGEAREVAAEFVTRLAEETRPACLLAGGETTVTVRGTGKGGRNQEFALAAAIALESVDDAIVLSAGTDGTDGPTDAAGAIATSDTLKRAGTFELRAQAYLDQNNSYEFFDRLGDLVRTGPTGTNVMDVHILLAR